MTQLGSCSLLTEAHLRPWNTERLIASNTQTDAKTPDGVSTNIIQVIIHPVSIVRPRSQTLQLKICC